MSGLQQKAELRQERMYDTQMRLTDSLITGIFDSMKALENNISFILSNDKAIVNNDDEVMKEMTYPTTLNVDLNHNYNKLVDLKRYIDSLNERVAY